MLPIMSSYWPWWISLICVLSIAALMLLNVKIELFARREQEDDLAWARISILHDFIAYELILPKFKLNSRGIELDVQQQNGKHEEAELEIQRAITHIEAWTEAFHIIKDGKAWLLSLLRKVKLYKWTWHSRAGTGEAMSSAISCGMLWSVKGYLFGSLSRHVQVMDRPDVRIEPSFQQARFETRWSCIVKVKVAHLLVAGILLLFHIPSLKRSVHLWRMLVTKT